MSKIKAGKGRPKIPEKGFATTHPLEWYEALTEEDYLNPEIVEQILREPPPRMYEALEEMPHYKCIPKICTFGNSPIPKEWIIPEVSTLTVQDIVKEENVETRRFLINAYPGKLQGFLRDGGGRVVWESSTNHKDYQYASILEMDFAGIQGKRYYLLLINRSIEQYAIQMSPEEREKSGLTRDGFKKYILSCAGPRDYEWLFDAVGSTFRLPPGEYFPDFES